MKTLADGNVLCKKIHFNCRFLEIINETRKQAK